VLLLQPCELGFEFALIFVGHGCASAEKSAMRFAEAPKGISSLPVWSASITGSILTIRYICPRNMRPPFLISIDRFGRSCTLGRPDRI
jgi:hypothetical protein